jgi:hypothetical protein
MSSVSTTRAIANGNPQDLASQTAAPPMPLCAICRRPLTDIENDICWSHERGETVSWAAWNKAFCDWLHRGVGRLAGALILAVATS